MVDALRVADDVLRQGVQGICDLVTIPGLINLDLADVRTIMTGAGTAHMGIGVARGENRAQKAADMAVNSNLLETSIEGARGILLNISGGEDLSLFEVNEVAEVVNHAADPDANIIFGAVIDTSLGDQLRVTVVAAGFENKPRPLGPHHGADATGEHQGVVAGADGADAAPGETPPASAEDLEVPAFLRLLDDEKE
jgi:cell division protein FtsZ